MYARLRPHLPALALACALSVAWALKDWSNFSALRLPDTDDAMRLQQVRDWIGGQGFFDLHQYRLGGGLLMHWSRIGDLFPAATIVTLDPLVGRHVAEVTAVILWPLLQFAAFLALIGSIARRLAPDAAGPALVLGALAYPTTSLFMPGRIDHHAVQIVLALIQLRALLAPQTARSGAVAGVAVAVSAAIGLETLPFAVTTGAVLLIGWWQKAPGAPQGLRGFGITLAVAIVALLPIAGQGQGCDTLQPLALTAVVGALALAVLSFAKPGWAPLFAAVGITTLAATSATQCLSGPYGAVDPLVARLWLAHVEEAQPLLGAPVANAIGYSGLLLAGCAASGWLIWQRGGAWWTLFAFQLVSLLLTLSQLRGAYLGAALAAIPIAALIVAARARQRLAAVLALWLAGAGLLYPMIAAALAPKATGHSTTATADTSCTSPQALTALGSLPPGRIMAPIDLGAFAIAGTRHAAIAGPYHRNNAGNAAMYRFFLGSPDRAREIARQWHVRYVALCPGAFAEAGALSPGSIADGARPDWLAPVAVPGGPTVLKVVQ